MKQKKIRGHKRLQKKIGFWRQSSLSLDLDNLSYHKKDYVKIYVHPWSGLSLTNSSIPLPYGKTKQDILNSLLDIYYSWKMELEKSGKPFYLKIWLIEPRFSTSQVVCAIDDKIDYYNNIFNKLDHFKPLNQKDYGKLQDRISKLKWECFLDEDHHFSSDLGEPELYASVKDYEESKIRFNNLFKKPHKKATLNDGITEIYSFKRGNVWVGGQ